MTRIFARASAIACALVLSVWAAAAANLPPPTVIIPVKAAATPAEQPLNMTTGWQGFYAGASMTATGTGVSLGNLGSLTSGGSAIGFETGWESFNGMTLFGARAGYAYDVMATSGAASFSDHSVWHLGPVFGGNLGQLLGFQSSPQANMLTQFFAQSVPYVSPEVCGHHGMVGYCTSIGVESVIPNTRLTAFAEYVNGQFGGQSPQPGQAVSTDNSVKIGVNYHF